MGMVTSLLTELEVIAILQHTKIHVYIFFVGCILRYMILRYYAKGITEGHDIRVYVLCKRDN